VPVLSDDQIKALLKTCTGKTFADRRDQAILRLLLDSGMRNSECVGINRAEIDWVENAVLVRVNDGGGEPATSAPRPRSLSIDTNEREQSTNWPEHQMRSGWGETVP
jgi:integrase/recombinase XerD